MVGAGQGSAREVGGLLQLLLTIHRILCRDVRECAEHKGSILQEDDGYLGKSQADFLSMALVVQADATDGAGLVCGQRGQDAVNDLDLVRQ